MNKNNKIILTALGVNCLLALLTQLITGSATAWVVFIILVASFLPIMLGNAKRERESHSQENDR
ncbi:MAG: hypothetical protein Fur0022_25410 [Anaerolineales bacterium]